MSINCVSRRRPLSRFLFVPGEWAKVEHIVPKPSRSSERATDQNVTFRIRGNRHSLGGNSPSRCGYAHVVCVCVQKAVQLHRVGRLKSKTLGTTRHWPKGLELVGDDDHVVSMGEFIHSLFPWAVSGPSESECNHPVTDIRLRIAAVHFGESTTSSRNHESTRACGIFRGHNWDNSRDTRFTKRQRLNRKLPQHSKPTGMTMTYMNSNTYILFMSQCWGSRDRFRFRAECHWAENPIKSMSWDFKS